MVVVIPGKQVLPASPFWLSVKVPHIDDVSASIVSAVTLKTYDSAVNANSVVTSGNSMRTTVDSDTSIVVVRPGKSTAVSTPLTVTWVCWDGMVISVVASPVKEKAVCLEENDRDSVVASNIKVVVHGRVWSATGEPLMVGVTLEFSSTLVVSDISIVMVVAATAV